jgi:hypothetical protein
MKPLLAVLLCGLAAAQAETNLERGKRVIAECLDALGGERFRQVQHREQRGRAYNFYREQVSGLAIATIYVEYDSSVKDTAHQLAVRERENFGKKQDYGALFTYDAVYEITYRGTRQLEDERFERYKSTTLNDIFYILRIRLNEPGMTMESRGSDVVDNRAVEIVDIVDADNNLVTVYFDQITKLPVRQVFKHRDPKTRINDDEVTLFTKYRTVEGIQWPFAIQRDRNGDKIFELFSDLVNFDKSIPEKLFVKP